MRRSLRASSHAFASVDHSAVVTEDEVDVQQHSQDRRRRLSGTLKDTSATDALTLYRRSHQSKPANVALKTVPSISVRHTPATQAEDDEGTGGVAKKRIFVCRKESMDHVPPENNNPEMWTGTFVDPRFRPADPENSLTGQLFAVNGFRKDSMTVTAAESKLRLWRNTTIAKLRHGGIYRTPRGLLGYEWDTFSDDCFRPPGLFALSKTALHVQNYMSESFGASYRGSGYVTHKLAMYRHIPAKYRTEGNNGKAAGANSQKIPSSLVFGTGTVQWSWALSDFRDGDPMPLDMNIQQATVNFLADMGVQPQSFQSGTGIYQLEQTTESNDNSPPISSIDEPRCGQSITVKVEESHAAAAMRTGRGGGHGGRDAASRPRPRAAGSLAPVQVLVVRGTAEDVGGGAVAGVEVSLDGGFTWSMAEGREKWVYRHEVSYSTSSGFCALRRCMCSYADVHIHISHTVERRIVDSICVSNRHLESRLIPSSSMSINTFFAGPPRPTFLQALPTVSTDIQWGSNRQCDLLPSLLCALQGILGAVPANQ